MAKLPVRVRCEKCSAITFIFASPAAPAWQCASCGHVHPVTNPLPDDPAPGVEGDWRPTPEEQRRIDFARHLVATGRLKP